MKIVPIFRALALALCAPTSSVAQDDPFLWLEDVESESALAWVEARNAETMAELGQRALFEELRADMLEILTSDDRIVYPSMIGGMIYNYWTDEEHPRGYYRRTEMDSYVSGAPRWETVLDVDALAAAEGIPWAFGGMTCLAPEYRHCMVGLSRGGSDARELREFDLQRAEFVDGFFVPEAKTSVAWVDEGNLLVATDFGTGSLTTAGYPRTVRTWTRGTSLEAARTIYEVPPTDVGVFALSTETINGPMVLVGHRVTFFEASVQVLRPDGLVRLAIPMDADHEFVQDQLVVMVRTPWEVGGRTFSPGTVIATDLERFLAGEQDFSIVVEPGPRSAVLGIASTRDYMLVALLENVRSQLWRYRHEGSAWTGERIDVPELGTVEVVDSEVASNEFFFQYSSFTQPTTLYLHRDDSTVQTIAQLAPQFDAAGLGVEQLHATSADGTPVPYFVVRARDLERNGRNPTLLYAYGGFELPETSRYYASVGKSWVERGGVYVVANIRGGGEFGPHWHRAGLKENRQRVYDDFLAVAEDLVGRGITTPPYLGIIGASNGGLLTAVAMTQRPDLFGAVVSAAPLIDMRRYHRLLAGASWTAEYGNPDLPEEWAYIRAYSPYQNVFTDRDYPPVLFTSTTRDDRVHPGHARKMAAKMLSQGHAVSYFENTEGGHGAGVTPEQRALMTAVEYAFLWSRLGGRPVS